jgi:hypothetical protein
MAKAGPPEPGPGLGPMGGPETRPGAALALSRTILGEWRPRAARTARTGTATAEATLPGGIGRSRPAVGWPVVRRPVVRRPFFVGPIRAVVVALRACRPLELAGAAKSAGPRRATGPLIRRGPLRPTRSLVPAGRSVPAARSVRVARRPETFARLPSPSVVGAAALGGAEFPSRAGSRALSGAMVGSALEAAALVVMICQVEFPFF